MTIQVGVERSTTHFHMLSSAYLCVKQYLLTGVVHLKRTTNAVHQSKSYLRLTHAQLTDTSDAFLL